MALEDHLFAVDYRHVGQWQLEDDSTHHLDVIVGYDLLHDSVLALDVLLNVRPSDDCRRHLSYDLRRVEFF